MDILLKKKAWYVRYRYYLIAATAFIGFITYAVCLSLEPKKTRVRGGDVSIAEVKDGRFMEYVDAEGVVHPIMTIKINPQETGFVSRIVAEEGAILHKGDTILILQNPELMRTISDEQDEWERQQRLYREQEIEMQQKSITLRQQVLDTEYEMSNLDEKLHIACEEYSMGVKSKAELEMAEAEYNYRRKKAALQMQSLRHDSTATILRSELLRGDISRTDTKRIRTQQRAAGLVVTAPTDGQLSFLNVTPGQQVSAGVSIGEIKVLSNYKVHVVLNEYYVERITSGLPASITVQKKNYPLRVTHVVPEVKERTFEADLVFTGDRPSSVRVGKSFRMQIELGQPERAIVIPRGDFYNATGGNWIYRLSKDGKTAVRTPISIGRQNPQQYEILSGLKAGDKVIVNGYEKFGDEEIIIIAD